MTRRLLIDTREFLQGRNTGIGTVLRGLIDALKGTSLFDEIILTEGEYGAIPDKLIKEKKIKIQQIPSSFIGSEKAISDFTKDGIDLFISPYPKLPLFGVYCRSINIVHDVLDLTHAAYRRRFKTHFDKFRLKNALKIADLTWYVSEWSMNETAGFIGFVGKNPRVRYSAISETFNDTITQKEDKVLETYGIQPGSILVIGNGMPHKNLGVLLEISKQLTKQLVFIGVSQKKQAFWKSKYPGSKAVWTKYVADQDMPVILRRSFCLAQPSTAEGYGFPPLEAMACGVPAVVSNIPVLVETTGGHALIAEPDIPDTWQTAFEMLENKDLYQAQAREGLEWVKPLWGRKGWDKHISDIKELVREN